MGYILIAKSIDRRSPMPKQLSPGEIALRTTLFCLLFFLAPACFGEGKAPTAGEITTTRLLHADSEPGEWFTGGRDYRQSYYSPLSDINVKNAARLGFAWGREIDTAFVLQAT